jgi:hypothetical protein
MGSTAMGLTVIDSAGTAAGSDGLEPSLSLRRCAVDCRHRHRVKVAPSIAVAAVPSIAISVALPLSLLQLLLLSPPPPPPPAFVDPFVGWLLRCCPQSDFVIACRHATIDALVAGRFCDNCLPPPPPAPPPQLPLPPGRHHHHRGQTHRHTLMKEETAAAPPYQLPQLGLM